MSLDLKKTKLDLLKCQTAKAELEYKIEERLADIDRMKDHIKLQEKRMEELKKQVQILEEKN